jgi:rhamnosyl/mannosyltransferase
MRILQIGKYSQERCGGVETAVYGLCEELAKEHDVELVVHGRVRRREKRGRFVSEELPTLLTAFSAPIAPALVAYLRRGPGFDVVQVSLQNPAAVLAYLLARPAGRLVVWYHHDIVRQKILGFLLRPLQLALLSRADAIVATSRAYAESSAALRAHRNKVRVIPLGIDADKLVDDAAVARSIEIRKRFDRPLVVFVGRLVHYKGLGCLIEAMRGLRAQLLIVGSGPLEGELRALTARLGLEGQVLFQAVPRSESVAPYLLACDLAVLPSIDRTEAFGLSLLEAMACGKPVIATELGTGTSWVCEDGVNGLVVPPRDSGALRRAIERLLSDPELSRRLGEAGRRKARSLFSLSGMAGSFVELYRKLLEPPC